MPSPFTALLFSLYGGLIRRTPGDHPPWLVSSDRHGIARVLNCPGPSYAIWPWKPSCASFRCSLRAVNTPCLAQVWGAPCTRTRPLPASGSSLCVPVRVEVHASKRAAFSRRMSVHFRGSFLLECVSRLALEWPSQRPNISISPRESFALTDPRTSISFSLSLLSSPFHSFPSPYSWSLRCVTYLQ